MTVNWKREKLDPIAEMRRAGGPTDHVTCDPKMRKGEYYIVRQSTSDGTMLFTEELIQRALVHLAAKASFYNPRKSEYMAAKDVRYVVGPMRMCTVFGRVKLPCSETQRYPGQRQRVRIPVKMVVLA